MNRLRQLKKSDWIAIALTGVLILIIAMPLSPKQSDSESTAERLAGLKAAGGNIGGVALLALPAPCGGAGDSCSGSGFREHAGQPECICGCDGKEAEACAWADGGGRRDRGDDHAIRFR